MSTRILHVSDTHIGKHQYNSDKRAQDFSEAFNVVCQYAVDENIDLVLHTGDLFDNRDPKTKHINDVFNSLQVLQEHNIPFWGIVGNHERKWDEQWLTILEKLDNVSYIDTTGKTINDVTVYGFDSFRESEWKDENFHVSTTNNDTFTIMCFHELFTELVPEHKADRSLSRIIDNINVTPDFIALGDYHYPEETLINDNIPATYAGATERTSSTMGEPTVRIIEIENKTLQQYNWIEVRSLSDKSVPRPFYRVTVTINEETTQSDIRRQITENITNEEEKYDQCVMYVELKGDKSRYTSSDIYQVLENLGFGISYVNDKRERSIFTENNTQKQDNIQNTDLKNKIHSELQEQDLSSFITQIEEGIVRDKTVAKSNIRSKVRNRINNGDKNEN